VPSLVKLLEQENMVSLSLRWGTECIVNSNLQQLLGSVPGEHACAYSAQQLQLEFGWLLILTGVFGLETDPTYGEEMIMSKCHQRNTLK